jgi:small subunit ribosomal protein S8
MVIDTVADLMARLKNGIMRRKGEVAVPAAKMITEILRVLKEEGMIGEYTRVNGAYTVNLLYTDSGEPVAQSFRKISKSGQRIYVSANEILPVMNGRGISIISTSTGVMSGAMAKSKGIGGELICEIW